MGADGPRTARLASAGPSAERRATPFRAVRGIAKGEDCEIHLATMSRHTTPGAPRWVALKRLRSDRLGDAETREAFVQEVILHTALRHPRIPRVFDSRSEGRNPYLITEYVDGPDLATLLLELGKRGRRLDLRSAWFVMLGIAEALQYLHAGPGPAQGAALLHGDVVADNVLLSADGVLRLTDLGRGWIVTAGAAPPRSARGFTPALSPEQARGHAVDHRSDVFLFGALLYECLTGRHPFLRDTVHETAREVGRGRPVPLESLRPVPPELAALVDRCMAVDPDRRFSTAEALTRALLRLELPGVEGDRGRGVLAAEIASVFPGHDDAARPWVLRGGSFRPPFLPMVLSWLPPPMAGPEAPPPLGVVTGDGPTQLGPETARMRTVDRDLEIERFRDDPHGEADEPPTDEGEAAPWELPPIARPALSVARKELAVVSLAPPASLPPPAPPVSVEPRPRRKRRARPPAIAAPASLPEVEPLGPRGLGWSVWARMLLAGTLGAGLTALVFLLFVPRTPARAPALPAPALPRSAPATHAALVEVLLQCDAADASVTVDGVALGAAPVSLTRPVGAALRVTVQAPGHRSSTQLVSVPEDGGRFTIPLIAL